MKAIAYKKSLPITDQESLIDIELPQPIAASHDLLVRIKTIAVNPVDFKIRQNVEPESGEYKVLGWDAVGEVVATGDNVTLFNPGDLVYYAGDLTRQGSNAEYQVVDERVVGHKPKSLSDAEAAALPLTAITAWEMLFEHLNIQQQTPGNVSQTDEVILVVGAAGGVGSIMLQLAKVLTGATVIATASRESSQQWVKSLGADYVIDHRHDLKSQIDALNIGQVTHVASLNATDTYLDSYVDILAPFGRISLIDDPESLDVMKLKMKSLSLHWEMMFTRSMFKTADMIEQSHLLNRLSALVDEGLIKTTVAKNLGKINADNLKLAHSELEAGKSIGKIVLEGF